jgi:8-oxo-dGTP pyrophosphatase MutT (NUDIX family)
MAAAAELRPEVLARVATDGTSARRARGLALAAIRETWEETGLLVGIPCAAPARTHSTLWADFLRHGVLPDLSALDLVARAITPPGSPRRFDTRFFMADAASVHGEAHDQLVGSGELIELSWVPLDEAKRLDLPTVTEMVIGLVAGHLDPARPAPRVPFVRWRGDRNRVEYLE